MFGGKKNTTTLGVDIGTKVIRAVEVSGKKGKVTLENYGEVNLDIACKEFFRSFDKKTLNPSVDNISQALLSIIQEAGIKTKKVTFSLPDFSTFFTTFELPPMSKKEIDNAVGFEARKYIPLPLDELYLDWESLNSLDKAKDKNVKNKVFVTAVPKIIVEQYKNIATQAGLELVALEAEATALRRSIIGTNEPPTCLLEIGFQSTNVNIVDEGFMKISSSFDMAGKDLTLSIAETLNIESPIAEKMKKQYGLLGVGEKDINHILMPILSVIADRTRKVIKDFESREGKKVERVVVAGGTSLLPGIMDFFGKNLSQEDNHPIKVELAKPFVNVFYPTILDKKMEEVNPTYAIALGEALRNLE